MLSLRSRWYCHRSEYKRLPKEVFRNCHEERDNTNKAIKNAKIKVIQRKNRYALRQQEVSGSWPCLLFFPLIHRADTGNLEWWDKWKLPTSHSGPVAILRMEECFPGMGPSQDVREKENYHLNCFVTEKWPSPLAFSPTSAPASSSDAVTQRTEIMKKQSVKMFGRTTPSPGAKGRFCCGFIIHLLIRLRGLGLTITPEKKEGSPFLLSFF